MASRASKGRRRIGLAQAADRLGLRVHGNGIGGDMNGYLVSVDYTSQNDSNRTRIRVAYPEWLGFNLRVATDQLGQLRKIPLFGQVMPAQDIQIGDENLDTDHLIQGDEHLVRNWFNPKRKDMIERASRNFVSIEITDRRVETMMQGHLRDPDELAKRVRAVVFMAEVASVAADEDLEQETYEQPAALETYPGDPFASAPSTPADDAADDVVDVELIPYEEVEPEAVEETLPEALPPPERVDEPGESATSEPPVVEAPVIEPAVIEPAADPRPIESEPMPAVDALRPEPALPATEPALAELPDLAHDTDTAPAQEPVEDAVPVAEATIAEVELPPSIFDQAPSMDSIEAPAREAAAEASETAAPSAATARSISELADLLFGDFQPAYRAEELFEGFKGTEVTWSGHVESVGEFSRHRHLGEGPGTEVELVAHEMEDGRQIVVFAGLPADVDVSEMGRTVQVTGTLTSIDAIMRRIYLTNARVA